MSEDVEDRVLRTDTPISDLIPTEEADPELVAHLHQSIADLQHEVEVAKATHRSEVAIITERLIDAADQNDMCSTYDAVIDALNKHLTVPLGVREQEQTVQVRGRIVIDLDRYLDVPLPYNANLADPGIRAKVAAVIQALGLRWIANDSTASYDLQIENVDWE